ncbi:Bug family tripartite tricarboxylate transporter substrate binding protein [Pacificibacter marinus]|uniref:Bug family tripartite tricarboxylate transporter substrate binding protein n=1 Tax=Pacificibacter marinus TaxID=658057 RepID=UPI001C06EBB4|nr:tripartite tricarboxylate transporter substrate binding protein [Pacificibacter marinus]MBU2867816.1 tripartite tricarboxylate transporter substrate binding protein [Pacificibacter marinus]
MKKRNLFTSALCLATFAALPFQAAFADDAYPSKPIHITVVWPAGGGHDLVGRLIGHELSTIMDTAVVVDNVTGAGGSTGIRHIAKADPDGYTIGVMGLHAVSQSYMNTSAPQLDGLDPLAYVSDEPGALQISADTGIDTLEAYVAAMKEDPMGLMNGNDPQGGNSFVFAEVIPQALGTDMMRLPYPGHAPTVTALLTGEVQTATLPIPPILEHALAGTINVLGVASETRHPQLPDVPTFKEQGYDVVVNDFVMMVAPVGIPTDIRAKLESGLLAAVNSEGFVAAAKKSGMVLRPLGATDAAAELAMQQELVYPLLENAGLVAPELKRD